MVESGVECVAYLVAVTSFEVRRWGRSAVAVVQGMRLESVWRTERGSAFGSICSIQRIER